MLQIKKHLSPATALGNPGTYQKAKTVWILLETHEWTMSRYGYDAGAGKYRAWHLFSNVHDDGWNGLTHSGAIRPVFYITSNIQYKYVLGTIEYPFIIH